tara:strand:+ start:986 stop:1624 length:639 start_codon:yes stop_codon:yes gene_type:complete
MKFLYPIFRTLLYPLIILADFLQNNFTSFFQPMNMGPTSKDSYANFIKKNFNKKNYVLDYGCGAGFFSQLFNPKKYLGVEINKSFLNTSRIRNSKHTFKLLKKNYLKGYENKIDYIFINNVLHHLTDDQILETFIFFKKTLKKKIKVFIVEPLLPKSFFSVEFFMKVLDIGDNIKDKRNYVNLLKKILYIKSYYVKKVSIGSVLVVKGNIKK